MKMTMTKNDITISGRILNEALHYAEIGLSVIPVGQDKKPLISWQIHQKKRASKKQVMKWFTQFPYANVAVVTGAISGIVVVDVEAGGKTENLPPTSISKTGGGGWHFFYKHPGKKVANAVRIKELTDIRGDGGYVVMPPSLHESGSCYEWSVALEDTELADAPVWVLEHSTGEGSQKDWDSFIDEENPKGTRNCTAAQFAGKLLHDLSPELWESAGWISLIDWNLKRNIPPLPEQELRQVWESIKGREEKNLGEPESQKKTQSQMLLEIIEDNPNIELFHDEASDPHVRLPIETHHEIWRCRSKQFKRWLAKLFWEKYGKTANSDAISNALNVIEGKACFDGREYQLANRVAWRDDCIWYDLSNTEWRAVRIDINGWEVVHNPPILFRRYSHQKAQPIPEHGGTVKAVLEFVNITDENQQMLFLVCLVSCFIPDFPHPIMVVYGSQGSAKSSLSRIVKLITDPSVVEISEFPKNQPELIQKLSHHWSIFFDNVSYLPNDISDILCRAVTGAGFSKRELYSDDDDILYSFRRCIGLNGINLVAQKPDLLERSILFELQRPAKSKRRQDKKLFEQFELERPKILGAIFDAISMALTIKDAISLPFLPRMADFAVWGCAIAEAIGYTQEAFLDAYYKSINDQNKEVIFDSTVAQAILHFMEDKPFWKGAPSDLLEELKSVAGIDLKINVEKEKSFPKAANALTRKLNQLKQNLEEAGIVMQRDDSSNRRKILLQKIAEHTVQTVQSSYETIVETKSVMESPPFLS
jgi:hypothetical protein